MTGGTAVSRAVALAALAGLAFVIHTLVFSPLWDSHVERRDTISALTSELARFEKLADANDELTEAVDRLQELRRSGRHTLSESSPSLAAAALQDRLKVAVGRYGGRIESTQVLPILNEGAFTQIIVSATMELTLGSLQSVLHEIESVAPYLVIEGLAVAARQIRWSGNAQGEENEGLERLRQQLDVRINVSGVVLGEGA